jgi:hypothetical protein
VRDATVAARISGGWFEPFALKRTILGLALGVAPMALCLTLGQGLISLLALVVGCWPWPVRIGLDRHGLTLRWLLVKEALAWSQLGAARLEPDPRRWVIGSRQVLTIERRGAAPLLVFGNPAALKLLEQAIARTRDDAKTGD